MKVGVLFPSRFEDPGEFLADARAMETAGIDSIWLQDQGDGLDPLLMMAAIASVTSQIRLGLLVSSLAVEGQGGGSHQRRIETLKHLSRERTIVLQFPSPPAGEGEGWAFNVPSPLLKEGQGGGSSERWQRVDVPIDRAAWATTLERAQRDGAHGVLVPFGPRLLDILRHPDDAIDRSDLVLAQG